MPPLQDPIGVAVTAVDVTAEFEPDPELSKVLDGYSSAVDGKMEEVIIFIIVIFLIIIFLVVIFLGIMIVLVIIFLTIIFLLLILLIIIFLMIIFLTSYSPVE